MTEDIPSILLVAKLAELDRHNAAMLASFANEASDTVTSAKGSTAGGDRRRLRGVPAIARGVWGGMLGTLPRVEIERLDCERHEG